jgi:hypothetical protein
MYVQEPRRGVAVSAVLLCFLNVFAESVHFLPLSYQTDDYLVGVCTIGPGRGTAPVQRLCCCCCYCCQLCCSSCWFQSLTEVTQPFLAYLRLLLSTCSTM